MSTHPAVVDVTAESFQTEVLDRSHTIPVVVDFWAEWCGPCRKLGPVLESLAEQSGGAWTLAKIDTDQERELAGSFSIRGIPAVKAFVKGEVVAEFTGVQGEGWLREWLAGLSPSEADCYAEAAAMALAAGDLDAAQAQVQAALGSNATHGGALVVAAELCVERGELDVARDALSRLSAGDRDRYAADIARLQTRIQSGGRSAEAWMTALAEDPDSRDLQWGAAHAWAAEGQHEEALKLLLAIVRADRSYREDGARVAMLALFQEIGDRTALAKKYRRKLEMTLF